MKKCPVCTVQKQTVAMLTVCPRSIDPFYITTYYVKWVQHFLDIQRHESFFWTYSIFNIKTMLSNIFDQVEECQEEPPQIQTKESVKLLVENFCSSVVHDALLTKYIFFLAGIS